MPRIYDYEKEAQLTNEHSFLVDKQNNTTKSVLAEDIKHYVLQNNSIGYLSNSIVDTESIQILNNKKLNNPKINSDVALLAKSEEINTLAGVNVTTAELNRLIGLNVTANELNSVKHNNGNFQQQIDKLTNHSVSLVFATSATSTTYKISEDDIKQILLWQGLEKSIALVPDASIYLVENNKLIDESKAVITTVYTVATNDVNHLDYIEFSGLTANTKYRVFFTNIKAINAVI